jgi:hypothetical protein
MEISQDDRLLISEQTRDAGDLDWKSKFEDYLRELKKEVGEQPFLCLAIAFLSGLISHTFPARFLFRVLARLVSWSVGPAIVFPRPARRSAVCRLQQWQSRLENQSRQLRSNS